MDMAHSSLALARVQSSARSISVLWCKGTKHLFLVGAKHKSQFTSFLLVGDKNFCYNRSLRMSGDTNEMVLNIIERINKSDKNADVKSSSPHVQVPSKSKEDNKDYTQIKELLRGKPKSGRFWKSKKERFSSIVKTKGIKPDFQRKTALRLELKRTKELSKQIQEQIKEKEQVRKERRRENLKRAEENKKKSEIVQVITNTAKLKRMKKKQLRFIEKRDTNKGIKTVQ